VRLDAQLLRRSPGCPLGFGISESVTCSLLKKSVDHAVRLHAGGAEKHQEVVGRRIADSGDGAECELRVLHVVYIDLTSFVYPMLTKNTGRLPDGRCLQGAGWRGSQAARGHLEVAELASPVGHARRIDLGDEGIKCPAPPVARIPPIDNVRVDSSASL
jgi:hypothetical protein